MENSIITYPSTWKIRDFSSLLNKKSGWKLYGEDIEILLQNGGGSTLWKLSCLPISNDGSHRTMFFLRLNRPDLDKLVEGELKAMISFSLLKRSGGKMTLTDMTKYNQETAVAFVPNRVLEDSAEILMPGGTLTVLVEIEILPANKTPGDSGLQLKSTSPEETVDTKEGFATDMLDSYVDLGPSGVLLVFKDGEFMCHTFPLAAR